MGTGRTDGFRKDAVRIALTGGLTQTALAEKAGANRETVAGIEARRKQSSVASLRALADALGVSLDDLAK